jgi:hypothetical protein
MGDRGVWVKKLGYDGVLTKSRLMHNTKMPAARCEVFF